MLYKNIVDCCLLFLLMYSLAGLSLNQLQCDLLQCLTTTVKDSKDIILVTARSAYVPMSITLIKIIPKWNITGLYWMSVKFDVL